MINVELKFALIKPILSKNYPSKNSGLGAKVRIKEA
jgi:hypothetical protein